MSQNQLHQESAESSIETSGIVQFPGVTERAIRLLHVGQKAIPLKQDAQFIIMRMLLRELLSSTFFSFCAI